MFRSIARLWRRLRILSHSSRDREIRTELQLHIDLLQEEYEANGMTSRKARLAAHRQFGNVVRTKERSRQVFRFQSLDDLVRDSTFAVRSLWKDRGFTIVAVFTLALGIGATAAIFSVVNAVMLQPLPFQDPDRVVRVLINRPPRVGRAADRLPLPLYDVYDVRAQSETLNGFGLVSNEVLTLTGVGDPVRLSGARVSPTVLSTLGIAPVGGRLFETGEETPGRDHVALLKESVWQRYFQSDPDILGRVIVLDGESYTVVGMMAQDLAFPEAETDFWIPFPVSPVEDRVPGRVEINGTVMARLADGVSLEQAIAEVNTIFRRLHPSEPGVDVRPENSGRGGRNGFPRNREGIESGRGDPAGRGAGERQSPPDVLAGATVELVPIQEEMMASVRPALLVLMGAVGLVLMIACVNVANLLLTRVSGRQLEMAIRVALGAGRFRIARQVLTESVILALAGGILGTLLAYGGVRTLSLIEPGTIPRMNELSLDVTVLVVTLGISAVTGIFFGLAPAFRLSKYEQVETLKEGGRTQASSDLSLFGRNRTRSMLVTIEVALAVVLLIGGGLLINSFTNLTRTDPGYDARDVLAFAVNLPQARYPEYAQKSAFYTLLLERLRAMNGVQFAAATSNLPLSPGGTGRIGFQLPGESERMTATVRSVTPGYFETMRMPLVQGSVHSEQDRRGLIVVNATFATRYFPDRAVGQEVDFGTPVGSVEIIGVVRDIAYQSLDSEIQPEIFFNYADMGPTAFGESDLTFALRTAPDSPNVVQGVRRAVLDLDASLPIDDVRTMEDRLYASVAEPRFYAILLGIFAAIALLLATVGIYGVLAYSVEQRRKEIGLRMALGAQRGQILGLVVSQGMILAVIGIVVGLCGAFGLTRYLESMLYGLTALDPMTFVGMTLVLIMTATVACYLPARRATRVDPMETLRHD